MTSAPYAFHANGASTLGGLPSSDYATDAELSASGTINSPSNPVDWTQLKSVPVGFADGTDDTAGGGISGGGTPGYVPKFVGGGTTIENSNIYETLGRVSIQVPLARAYRVVEEAKAKLDGHGKRFKFVMSHRTGKLEVVGIMNDYVYLRYHQAKDPDDMGRFFRRKLTPGAGWLDDLGERPQEPEPDGLFHTHRGSH